MASALLRLLVAVLAVGYAGRRLQVYLRRRRFKAEHGCQPLQARLEQQPLLLGMDNMYRLIKTSKEGGFLDLMSARYARLGNTFGLRMWSTSLVLTIEPQNIKTVLSLRFGDYGIQGRRRALGKLLGRGIFVSDGDAWSHSRALLRPNFAREQVANLPALEKYIQQLFQLIWQAAPPSVTTTTAPECAVDLQDLFFRFTIDTATEFLFGQSVGSLGQRPKGEAGAAGFAEAFNFAQEMAAFRFRIAGLSYVYRNRQEDAAVQTAHQFVDQFVDQAIEYRQRQQKQRQQQQQNQTDGAPPPAKHDSDPECSHEKGHYVFLRELANATDDRRRLRDELLNILLAGRDTTASLLSNLFFHLARRPDIWAKLQAEVAHLAGECPTYAQLRNLKYLKYCLNESLRVNPVVPTNSRVAIRDTVIPLGGGPDGKAPVFVPKGTFVGYHVYAMHRRTDYFGADAADFQPERWETLRPGWEYLPFNGGPRICLGQQYALTEASYVTVRLLQEFSGIRSCDPGPWQEKLTLTLCSRNGTKVALTPRVNTAEQWHPSVCGAVNDT